MNTTFLGGVKTERPPRICSTKDGQSVVDFTLKLASPTVFVDVTAWGELAEIAKNLVPGDFVFVDGKLRSESWERNGRKYFRLKVVATTLRRIVGRQDQHTSTTDEAVRDAS